MLHEIFHGDFSCKSQDDVKKDIISPVKMEVKQTILHHWMEMSMMMKK